MKPSNLEAINRSFDIQAANFESKTLNFSKEEYLNYTVSAVEPQPQDVVLEVAAGTCVCGRSFAPQVQTVICLDATTSMLQVGQQEAEKNQLHNMVFVKGYAQELPLLDNSVDIVLSRLAFHHFTEVGPAFAEMVRVLKPGGKLVMIDMEAPEEELRATEDEIETLRDPSHVKNLSKTEMQALYLSHGLTIEKCETTEIEQKLPNWMNLTHTPEETQKDIVQRMQADIAGGVKTGFYPYEAEGGIRFKQRWVLTLGRK